MNSRSSRVRGNPLRRLTLVRVNPLRRLTLVRSLEIAAAMLVIALPTSLYAQNSSKTSNDATPVEQTQRANRPAQGISVSLATGYGFNGAVLNANDTHHRGVGAAAFSYGFNNISVSLQFDGRYDRSTGGGSRDSSWVGDPRLFLHYQTRISNALSIGGRVGLWAPGSSAPSVIVDALSVEALTAITYRPTHRFEFSANVGYHFDRSAASVSDVERLSKPDQLSLGISDYNALLFRVEGSYQFSGLSVFSGWNLDLLHGKGKPAFRDSPMGLGLGLRYPISDRLRIFAMTNIRINNVSAEDLGSKLVPFHPKFRALVGITMNFNSPTDVKPIIVEPRPQPEPPTTFSIGGTVRFKDTPVSAASIIATQNDDVVGEIQTSEDGSFLLENISEGTTKLSVRAEGYEPATRTIRIDEDLTGLGLLLNPRLPPGQLRGAVRSFRGEPLKAKLTITPTGTVLTTMADGSFELDLPPGDYEVKVSVRGYKNQVRKVHIDEDGVTIVNIDLRK